MSEKPAPPAPPKGLSTRSRKLWREIVEDFVLAAAELELLRQALAALDLADDAAAIVAREGITVVDRYGSPKQHPACDVAARNQAIFGRFVAQLGVKESVSTRTRRGAKTGPRERLGVRRGGR